MTSGEERRVGSEGWDCGCDEAMTSGGWDDGSAAASGAWFGVMADAGLTLRSLGLVIYGESGSRTLSCCLLGVPVTTCGADVNVVGNVEVDFRVDLCTGAGWSAVYSPGGGMFSWPRTDGGSWNTVNADLADLRGSRVAMAWVG